MALRRHSHAEDKQVVVPTESVSWGAIEAGSQQEEQPWLHGSKEGPGRSDI